MANEIARIGTEIAPVGDLNWIVVTSATDMISKMMYATNEDSNAFLT